jgi:hypothetical protein
VRLALTWKRGFALLGRSEAPSPHNLARRRHRLPVLSQQPYAVDAGNPGNGNYVGHVLEINVVVGLDVGDPLYANSENIPQPLART